MTAIRLPRSTAGAAGLIELYAHLDGEVAAINAQRNASLARINAEADAEQAPLIERRETIRAKLAEWWAGAEAELTKGKRKSIELGGCMLGTRKSRASLTVAADELVTIAALNVKRWAKGLLRVRTTLDRTAILKALDGKHGDELAQLGLGKNEGEPVFYIERVEQQGTLPA